MSFGLHKAKDAVLRDVVPTVENDGEYCEGCNLYCTNPDDSHSCIAALINHYLSNNLLEERDEEEDEY